MIFVYKVPQSSPVPPHQLYYLCTTTALSSKTKIMDPDLMNEIIKSCQDGPIQTLIMILNSKREGQISLNDYTALFLVGGSMAKLDRFRAIELARRLGVFGLVSQGKEGVPLLHAVIWGNHEAAKVLLTHGANVNAQDNAKRTALYYAIHKGDQEMVGVLLGAGAEFFVAPNVNALHVASQASNELRIGGDVEIVRQLLEAGAQPDHQDNGGETALMKAARNRHDSVMKMIIANQAMTDTKNHQGVTALMIAAAKGNLEEVDVLLGAGAQLDLQDNNGETALMKAAQADQAELVELLLKAGAQKELMDKRGQTALKLARLANRTRVVELLRGYHQSIQAEASAKAGKAMEEAQLAELWKRLNKLRQESKQPEPLSVNNTQCGAEEELTGSSLQEMLRAGRRAARARAAAAERERSAALLEEARLDKLGSLLDRILAAEEGRGRTEEELRATRGELAEESERRARAEDQALTLRREVEEGKFALANLRAAKEREMEQVKAHAQAEIRQAKADAEARKQMFVRTLETERNNAQAYAEQLMKAAGEHQEHLAQAAEKLEVAEQDLALAGQELARLKGERLAQMTIADIEVLEQDLKACLEATTRQKEKLAKEELDNATASTLCVICLERVKSVLILPCRHLCLCQNCSENQELKACPLCRIQIENTIQTFV